MFKSLKIYKNQVYDYDSLLSDLENLGYKKVLSVKEEGDFSTKGEVLSVFPAGFQYPVRLSWELDRISSIYNFDPDTGLNLQEFEVVIILPVLKKRASKLSYSHQVPLQGWVDIKSGDFVVHTDYGIGIFRGKETIKGKDYFVIEYQDKAKVYVKEEDLHLIQKYISLWHKKPRLSKLGSKEWRRTKEKVQKGIHSFALQLLKREALRKARGGFKFSADTEFQEIFNSYFPYEETPDQKKAWIETKQDMESDKCMERLICGDVGYGKTEVAMRASFKAVMDSKQVAFLVPTTILAEQHYYNFIKRIKDLPVRVEMLSRFKTKSSQRRILEELRKGKIDIIIGTHRLLEDDVKFKDLGLLIIDEEQKFGVKAKEKLKSLKENVDVLILTATPIPRTLYLALSGIRDISIISTPPKQRLATKTFVCKFDKELIRQAILRESQRKGQVFFIHNRIKDIYKMYKFLKDLLPSDVSIGVAHGRMKSKELEEVMLKFIRGELDILLSTNIIESGTDIPQANTIIVNDAHNFGLSDLHQLRGRVGRKDVQGYAYFLVPSLENIPEDSRRRLEAIQQFSFLGAGFNIAMQDLEIRGAGNILGKEQHGFIYSIGLDLYCRLLKEEIERIKSLKTEVKNAIFV